MSWESLIKSEVAQKFGVSLVFIGVSFLVWQQMNIHIDGRLASQDARIEHMSVENVFMRDHIKADQEQRRTLFTAIQEHLKELSNRSN